MAAFKNTTNLSRRATLANLAAVAATTTLAAMAAPDAQANDHVLTAEEMAAIDFEVWQHSAGEWQPPSNVEWARLANPYLVTVRMAWIMMFKTKAELMEAAEGLDDDAGKELMDGFIDSIGFFERMLALLKAGEARFLVAGSAVELRDEAA